MAGISPVRVPQAMRGSAHLTVLGTVKQQPYLIIKTRVVVGVPVREVAFNDLCHFIAVGNHAWLRNPTNYPRLKPWDPVCSLQPKKPRSQLQLEHRGQEEVPTASSFLVPNQEAQFVVDSEEGGHHMV